MTNAHDDGWTTLAGADGVTVHVHAQWNGPQVMITGMYLHSTDGVTPASVQCLSISRLEAELTLLALTAAAVSADNVPTLTAIVNAAQAHADAPEPTLAELRARSPEPRPQAGKRPRLTRPGQGEHRNQFYAQVALAYLEFAAETNAPSKKIATEAGVPLNTAQRWVAEARRRRFLPQSKPGRAG